MFTRNCVFYWIVPAVRIQVQPVSSVRILLGEPPDHRVVIPGTQVILLADGVVLLAIELKTVLDVFLTERQIPPCVIFIAVKDILPRCHMSYTPQFVRGIVVVCPSAVRFRGDQVVAPDISSHPLLVLQFRHHFLSTEDKLYQSSVLLDPAAQTFRIVVVDLDVAVKDLYFLRPIEQVVDVVGPVVRRQVSGFIIGKCGRLPSVRVFGQVIGRVIAVFLLRTIRYTATAIPGLVLIELFRVGWIFYLGQLIHAVVGVAGDPAGLLSLRAVAVVVVAVVVVHQYFLPQHSLQAREVFVSVIGVLGVQAAAFKTINHSAIGVFRQLICFFIAYINI